MLDMYITLGDVQQQLQQHEKALDWYHRSLGLIGPGRRTRSRASLQFKMARAHIDLGNLSAAEPLVERSVAWADSTGHRGILISAYEQASRLYAAQKKYEQAYHYSRLFQTHRDTMIDAEKTEQLNFTRYQNAATKAAEAEQARAQEAAQVATQQLELKEKDQQLTLLLLASLFLAVLIAVAGIAWQRLRKVNKTLAAQKDEIATQASALAAANEQLQQVSSFKEGLTSMLVHDLKTPLNIIMGASSQPATPDSQETIQSSALQMLTMTLNILEVQQLEEAAMMVEQDTVNANAITTQAHSYTGSLFKRKNQEVHNAVPEDLHVQADAGLVERILINLLTNAYKYTPNNGRVSLGAEATTSGTVRLWVRNSGAGIARDDQHRIFEKFHRVQGTSSDQHSSGLGLAFCKAAIEAMGGSIGVESAPDSDTTFWIELPAADAAATATSTATASTKSELLVPDAEAQALLPVAQALQGLEIYEISKLREVLRTANAPDSEWLAEAKRAMHSGNGQRLQELVQLILQHPANA